MSARVAMKLFLGLSVTSRLCLSTVLLLGMLCSVFQAGELKGENVKPVRYSDFGAKGDGKADDIEAIAKAHAHANEKGLPVKADGGAIYRIGGKDRTVNIETDTDFGSARFIIDDTAVENHRSHIFVVKSKLKKIPLKGIASLKRDQAKIKLSLPQACLVSVKNKHVKHYIRKGLNQNSGSAATDVFLVDKNGSVDPGTPILWDFDQITEISAQPVDPEQLTIKGGHFTTMANAAPSKYTYYARNIAIRRSNVVVEDLEHRITGEGDHGAPYGGFLNVGDCANVTVKNSIFTGHKTYRTIGSAGKPVSMGTYDILLTRALNVIFVNCKQTNDIRDRKYWGTMASNYCKNLTFDKCSFSRFDAHKGVAHVTIRNSELGHMGIKAIGRGLLTVENTTVYSNAFVDLRPDYGSTWEGEFVIRNCVFVPSRLNSVNLIGGSNSGQHNFGYPCFMPERITIDGLRIEDKKAPANYKGPAIFAHFNRNFKSDDYIEKFPYAKPKTVILKNVTTASGKPLRLSDNRFMFKGVEVE